MRHTKAISDIGDIMDAVGKESYDELKDALEGVCSKIASKFGLYYKDGGPRKAAIIDIVAGSTCVSCILRRLSGTARASRIDRTYIEVHKLAINILIEELYDKFHNMGYSVSILSEAETQYGKVDVLIKPTICGIALQYGTNELMIEVKTGVSVSIPQIFRYLLAKENQTIILWRIRNRQVLSFDGELLAPLLKRFMKTCILRGQRLLAAPEQTSCKHPDPTDWSPTQSDLQMMFEEFAVAIVETLPLVTKAAIEKLGVKKIPIETEA